MNDATVDPPDADLPDAVAACPPLTDPELGRVWTDRGDSVPVRRHARCF